MKLMTTSLLLLAGCVLAVGCSDDDVTARGVGDGPEGSVTVQVNGDQAKESSGKVAAANGQVLVTFGYLALTREGASDTILVDGESDPVDLTQDNPLGTFPVPAGEYDGVVLEIADVQVVEEDAQGDKVTCPTTNADGVIEKEWTWQAPSGSDPWLVVDENGEQTLLVELPVIGGSCEEDQGTGEVSVSLDPQISVRIL